jgi:TPR repeat protein
MYHDGEGFEVNYIEAMKWYRRAVDGGNPAAMNNLGVMYHEGRGVTKNYIEAMKWYRKAAEAGHFSAMNNIAWMYRNGLGVRKDEKEAARWYGKVLASHEAGEKERQTAHSQGYGGMHRERAASLPGREGINGIQSTYRQR